MRKKILDIIIDLPVAVHGQHGVEQNLCNQPACGAVDAHSRELAQSRVVEELVQTTAQPQNEGYYGENTYIIIRVLSRRLHSYVIFQLDPLGLMDPLGECPAVEVFKFRDKDGYFGQVLTSITRYFGQVIAPSIKDSTATHIPFNRQRVAYHWNVMNSNGKRESFKGSVW